MKFEKRYDFHRRPKKEGAWDWDKEYFYHIELPLAEVAKDVRDTIKPYKSVYHILREPFFRVVSGVQSLAWAVGFAAAVVAGLFLLASVPFANKPTERAAFCLKWMELSVLAIAVHLAKAAMQLALSPLYILRMPVRGLITLVKGAPTVEDSVGLRALVKRYDSTAKSLSIFEKNDLRGIVISKFMTARDKWQKTSLTKNEVADLASMKTVDLGDRAIPLIAKGIVRRDAELTMIRSKL